jgi:hypothetical protein
MHPLTFRIVSLVVSNPLDFFRLFVVDGCKFAADTAIGRHKLVQFGMDCQSIAPVRALK